MSEISAESSSFGSLRMVVAKGEISGCGTIVRCCIVTQRLVIVGILISVPDIAS